MNKNQLKVSLTSDTNVGATVNPAKVNEDLKLFDFFGHLFHEPLRSRSGSADADSFDP